jgi:GT2 family glycosyltransferase
MAGAYSAGGDILLYTDDDVVIDARWIDATLAAFSSPRVGAAAGLTMPLELETPAQALFEYMGGHGRGFTRRVFDRNTVPPASAGQIGSGANMAFRRELVLRLGLFDAELDMGSVTLTGGDAHAFYRVLAEHYQIVYAPEALVWHCHRRDYPGLRHMLYSYTVGGLAHLTRCVVEYGDWEALTVAAWWLKHYHLKNLYRALRGKRDAMPLDITLAELGGVLQGPLAYLKARRIERARAPA